MFMQLEHLLLLLGLIEKGAVSSVTVTKTMIIVRIKK